MVPTQQLDYLTYLPKPQQLAVIVGYYHTVVCKITQKGFVAIRKGGKLPVAVQRIAFVDYGGEIKSLGLRHDALPPGQKVKMTSSH